MFEIAYAAATNRLCFFTGTGFSKSVTENQAPSWQGLLEELCGLLPESDALKDSLFPEDEVSPLSLEEAAQVISIKLSSVEKNIHKEISKIIGNVSLSANNGLLFEFFSNREFSIVTTNYDKLAEELTADNPCHSITPGLPIPKSPANVKIYHVHGSIDSPQNMVVTSEDYFRFINGNSYFSRKLSTVLHENTVVILGYSLGDTNLKAILSDYKGFSKSHVVGSNIFLISKSTVNQHVKDYYSYCYGIRVLDDLEIHEFFEKLNGQIPKVERIAEKSLKSIRKVVHDGNHFKEAYLKLEDSFYRILSAISAEGLSLNDPRVVKVIGEVIETKNQLTHESNAWEQYEHLARWLIYLGTIFEIESTSIQDKYLEATLRSMITMSKKLYLGYSWHAYQSWEKRWSSIIASNRFIIKKYIEDNTSWSPALSVVNSI
jgi:hypothetical protein